MAWTSQGCAADPAWAMTAELVAGRAGVRSGEARPTPPATKAARLTARKVDTTQQEPSPIPLEAQPGTSRFRGAG